MTGGQERVLWKEIRNIGLTGRGRSHPGVRQRGFMVAVTEEKIFVLNTTCIGGSDRWGGGKLLMCSCSISSSAVQQRAEGSC